ncbi:biotin-independent malonate decarboxylase subunit gamma [Bordetella genomosp. 8]|uniref:biotin-independent malonate decarboxylase subunit gamma n=1 Tax=Bordetella genomosp. 8 TaxID=1416806 RepID=UPI001E634305|nr:biotin-independent malonate decarboxylase subunit gamma [Bordetella genomosp. 8]
MESRGARWLAGLAGSGRQLAGFVPSVRVVDAWLGGELARYLAVVPDARNPFPRASKGEVGLLEGWELARAVREVVDADAAGPGRRPIVAVIDVPSQAYGRREEAYGIHLCLAGAAAAYAEARLAGHPVIGLIVGKAMSGGLLAHGYQANRLIALDDPGVMVHAMGKEAAARVTLRSVAQLEALAATIPPMAYDIESFARLGLLWRVLHGVRADAPAQEDFAAAAAALEQALASIRADADSSLACRVNPAGRKMSHDVRARLRSLWQDR